MTAEAIQRLYWACRRRQGFPGDPPDESTGEVTTTAILKGLGLGEPQVEESASPRDLQQDTRASKNTPRVQSSQQRRVSEPEIRPVRNKTVVSTSMPSREPNLYPVRTGTFQDSPPGSSLMDSQTPSDDSSGISSQPTLPEPSTPPEVTIQEQFISACALSLPLGARPDQYESTQQGGTFDLYLDSDNTWDTCSPTETIDFHSLLPFRQPTDPRDMQALIPLGPTPNSQPHQSLGGILSDGFLSPGPETLTAAYHPVAARSNSGWAL